MAIEMLVTWMSTVLRGALVPVRDDRGQTMAEYGLILAGIAVDLASAKLLQPTCWQHPWDL